MSNNFHLQLYRGTTSQNNAYTGLAGEITADTQAGNIRLHDGSKAGGYVVASMPVGSIIPYAGTTIPDGYLLCDGSAISRTTYSALFAAIGTTYGTGDGNSTFNLPNWSTVITAVSIPSTIAVYGNGKALGLTNGSVNCGLQTGTQPYIAAGTNAYDKNISTTGNQGAFNNGTYGIVSDISGKSGIVAKSNSITRTSLSIKFSIKY